MVIQKAGARWRDRRYGLLLFMSMLASVLIGGLWVLPALGQSPGERRVITRIEPEYPATLKRLYIGGAVRVQAVVTPDGRVESTQLLGGNPILGQAAIKAIKQWKYARGGGKEAVVVKLEFDPHR
jgi:TonB family protein